jgi:hypothetical protein
VIDEPFFYALTFAIGAKGVWDGLVFIFNEGLINSGGKPP